MDFRDTITKDMSPSLRASIEPILDVALTLWPDINRALPQTVRNQLIFAAQSGLILGSELHLQCRENWKTKQVECSRIIGYTGLLRLATRDKRVTRVACQIVYSAEIEGGHFTLDVLADPPIQHRPILMSTKRGEIAGAYAVAMVDGAWGAPEWMDIDELRAHAKAHATNSKGELSRVWERYWTEMCRKTVLRRFLKRAPVSEDLLTALAGEMTDEGLQELAGAAEPPPSPVARARVQSAPDAAPERQQPTSAGGPVVGSRIVDIGAEIVRLWPSIESADRGALEPMRSALSSMSQVRREDLAALLAQASDSDRRSLIRSALSVDIDALIATAQGAGSDDEPRLGLD